MERDREERNGVERNGTDRKDWNWVEGWNWAGKGGTSQRGRNGIERDGTRWYGTVWN